MKYLKYFESVDYLQSLCDDYLSYLTDKGIRIRVVNANTGIDEYAVLIMGKFRLPDIKDDIYQFIKMIRVDGYKPYRVPMVTFLNGYSMSTKNVSLGELLSRNDDWSNYSNHRDYREIRIFIKKV
jgi:hypothetical protein